jgi:deoxyribodipyrimidine photo-lyase
LNENAAPLSEDAAPVPIAPIVPAARHDGAPAALLLTEEDLHPESWDFAGDVRAIAVLPSATVHPPDSPAALFSQGALLDAAERAAAHFGVAAEFVDAAELPHWVAAVGVNSLLTGAIPTGMVAWQMQPVRAALGAQDIRLVEIRRSWDDLLWPRATAGFFKLKTALPKVISQLGL